MLIAIEAERANHPQKTGVEHYAKQLILQFAKLAGEDEKGDTSATKEPPFKHEFVLYLRTDPEPWFLELPDNFKIKKLGWGPIKFPFLWTQLRVSLEMLIAPPDVLFVPAASLPIFHPRKSFVTVHDVAWRLYPETFKTLKHWYLEFTTWFACQFAKKIIAVSHATKNDLVKYYKVNANKIEVVWHGYTPVKDENIEYPISNIESNIESNLDTKNSNPETYSLQPTNLQLPKDFLLFLSTLQPRKNLEGLVDAFRIFKNKHPESEYKLVVAGKVGWKAEKILKKIKDNEDIVLYLNHVNDEERDELYKHATALAVPSFYEGFGMWILEAFEAHIPVITSNVSSMPEVAGEAAEYSDPHNIESIEQAIENVLLNKERATQLVTLGQERLKLFSWEKCGKETLGVLLK
jgi:glycosyltransferase involved in cell wall biosynthesis